MYELRVSASFAAAHQLRNYGGKCERLHGHNWKVEAYVETEELDEKTGLALDFKEIKEALGQILSMLDHQNLNDLALFKEENPSSENIARYIHGELSTLLFRFSVRVKKISLWESERCCASYYPEQSLFRQ
jgi:6-pyruvoyltetrahydropterin/6-carboxytetrahydropterin synthase